jgi:RNA polymerase sigma-70 factor (ECF subfamily)
MPKPQAHRVEQPAVDRSALMVDAALLQAVRQVRAGLEVEAGFRIIDAHLRPRLLNYFRSHFFSSEDAKDLVQKTLARVYLGVQQLEQEEKFLTWLFVIARNVRLTAAEQCQRESRLMAGGIELAQELPDPQSARWSHDRQLEEDRLEAVQTAIEKLPAQQRQCLLLRVRDELSYEEIAKTLRLSVNTVRNHLAQAKKNLQERLKTELEGEVGR